MKPGEEFEIESVEYLRENYSFPGVVFDHQDTTDSTRSDIEVIKNGKSAFFIEAKDTAAQSGQFVLLSDDANRRFVFSPRNKSAQNDMTKIMIEYMNADYGRFNAGGTAGVDLGIQPSVFTKWIVGHYQDKNVKFVISKKDNQMIICPIEKFGDYFEVSAMFRIKKSGSSTPPAKSISALKNKLRTDFGISEIFKDGKKLYVKASPDLSMVQFELENFTYCLSSKNAPPDLLEIRKLSNTRNKNVIFTIHVKKGQDQADLDAFVRTLS